MCCVAMMTEHAMDVKHRLNYPSAIWCTVHTISPV